jgi:cyclophilin family peptidyl-prolyl cis-trans isomerase
MVSPQQLYQQQRREFLGASLATATVAVLGLPEASLASYIDPAIDPPKITKRVYLDVEFGSNDGEKGRLVIGLYGDIMPKTTENFEKLCASNAYAGTNFYRVISDLNIQGGAVGDSTGKTGQSSFENGKPFEPDNFNVKHTMAGIVSMVRGVGGSADSRFFVNIKDEAGWADDRYAAFGIVEEGMSLVKAIEKVPVSPPKNFPKNEVKIVASGIL